MERADGPGRWRDREVRDGAQRDARRKVEQGAVRQAQANAQQLQCIVSLRKRASAVAWQGGEDYLRIWGGAGEASPS